MDRSLELRHEALFPVHRLGRAWSYDSAAPLLQYDFSETPGLFATGTVPLSVFSAYDSTDSTLDKKCLGSGSIF